MKKSKVLKKSLSFLLAVLLVVAMVPFGASAADPTNPLLAELRVGAEGTAADINQSTKTISVVLKPTNSFNSVILNYTAKDGIGELYLGTGYQQVVNGNAYDLTQYKVSGVDGMVSVPLRVQDPINNGFFTDYMLTVQNKKVEEDVTIEKFTIDGQVGSTFEPGKLSFEILMPYNRNLDGSEALKTNIKLADSNSDHDWITTTRNWNTTDLEPLYPDYYPLSYAYFTVTGTNGATQEYEVIIRRAEAIQSFAIPNQTGVEIVWPNNYSNAFAGYPGEWVMEDGQINITIPKNAMSNANYLASVVPSFTSELGDVQPTKVELYYTSGTGSFVELKTGVTSANLTAALGSNTAIYVVATYPANTGGAKAVYALEINEEGTGSRATVNEAKLTTDAFLGMERYAEIKDDEIVFTVSESLDLRNVNLDLTLPVDAEASFTIGNISYGPFTSTGSNEYETVNFPNIDLRNNVVITIKSGTGVIKTYTVKTEKGETPGQPAKFKSVYLRNNSTGVVYEADATGLAGVNITFTVPRSTQVSSLTGYTLYYSAPIGAAITYKNGASTYAPLPKSSTVLAAGDFGTYGILPGPNYQTADTTEIVVKTYDDNAGTVNTTNYIVGFKYNDWVTDNKIQSGSFALTRARAASEVADANIYKGTVKTENTTNTVYTNANSGNLSVVEVTIPWVDYFKLSALTPDPMSHIALQTLGIADSAALYVQTADGNPATRYYPITDSRWTAAQVLDLTTLTTSSAASTEVRIFVLNEKGLYDLDRNGSGSIAEADLINAANAGNVTQYYLVAKAGTARSARGLKSLDFINSKNQSRTAAVANDAVTFNVPWSWARGDDSILSGGAADPNAEKLHFSYTAEPGNLLYETMSTMMIYSGGFKDVAGNYMGTANGDVYFQVSKMGVLYIVFDTATPGSSERAQEVQSLFVEAENNAQKSYSVNVNILPIQSGAEIKSFSVNGVAGTISGDTIKVVLPYGSKYDDVAPVFTASDMATVTFDDDGTEILSGVTELDFTKTVNLTVKSEDGHASTKYKVIVEAPMQFSDVKPGSWYYNAVMEAASLGFVNGYSDGTFKPANPVTRADFVLMLTRAMGVTDAELDAYTNNPFMDVSIDSYYAKAVAWASDKGYVTGYDNADFKPGKYITRQEAAALYCRVMGLAEVTNPSDSAKYKDHGAIAPWAVGYVYAVQNVSIMSGHSDGRFTPQSNLTRAQTAQAMVNYYHVK